MARILSISDEPSLLHTRELLLKTRGHSVASALGSDDAGQACARPGFDLLVVGHSIPKNTKRDLISRFRATNQQAKVIALTRADEPHFKEADVLLDPFNPEELLRAIDRVLEPTAERRSKRDMAR